MGVISILTLQDVSGIGGEAQNFDFVILSILQELIAKMGAVPINNEESVAITSQIASCWIKILRNPLLPNYTIHVALL